MDTIHQQVNTDFGTYKPSESEKEKASYCYLMSVIAFMIGLPIPIVNLLATLIFFIANRNSTGFVRWHTIQALLSQLTIFVINTIAFTWTLRIIFTPVVVTNSYVAYILTAILFNLFELAINIAAAIKVRKGQHVEFWFWGALTNLVIRNHRGL